MIKKIKTELFLRKMEKKGLARRKDGEWLPTPIDGRLDVYSIGETVKGAAKV